VRSAVLSSRNGLTMYSGLGLGTYPMMANDRFLFTHRDFNGVIIFESSDNSLSAERGSDGTIQATEEEPEVELEWIDHTLRTDMSGEVNSFGNFFDVYATSTIELLGLSVSVYESPHPLQAFVYTKNGSFATGEGSLEHWTPVPLVRSTIMGKGYTKDTVLRFVDPVSIPSGRLQGLYVTLTKAALYTSSSYKPVGEVVSQSGHLQILVGKSAVTPPNPSGIASSTPRAFNGRLDYRVQEELKEEEDASDLWLSPQEMLEKYDTGDFVGLSASRSPNPD